MKACTKCGEIKELSLFYKRKDTKDGYRTACKKCYNKQSKEYTEKNIGRVRAMQKDWRDNNYIHLKEYKHKYYKDNFKEIARKKKEYYLERRDATVAYYRRYYEKNKERLIKLSIEYARTEKGKMAKRAVMQKRKLQKTYTNDGTITSKSLEDLFINQGGNCKYCNSMLDFNIKFEVHLDHVVPLSKGGKHSINNVVWSCRLCNIKKGDKIVT